MFFSGRVHAWVFGRVHESTEEVLRLRMNGRVRIVVNSAATIDKLLAPRVAVVDGGVLSVASTNHGT